MRSLAACLLALSCSACSDPSPSQKGAGPRAVTVSKDPEIVGMIPPPPPFRVTRDGVRFEVWQECGVWKVSATRDGKNLWCQDGPSLRWPAQDGIPEQCFGVSVGDELELRVGNMCEFGLDLKTGEVTRWIGNGLGQNLPAPEEPHPTACIGGPFGIEGHPDDKKISLRSLGDGLGPWLVSCFDNHGGVLWSHDLPRGILLKRARLLDKKDEESDACIELSGSRQLVLNLRTGDILSHTR